MREKVDMSSAAIAGRLKRLGSISKLARELKKAHGGYEKARAMILNEAQVSYGKPALDRERPEDDRGGSE